MNVRGIKSCRDDLDEFEARLSLSPVRILALGPKLCLPVT